MTALEELRALVPPPLSVPSGLDWTAVERRLGKRLPTDYRAFVETYGTGVIDDFLWVLQPAEANISLNLLVQGQVRLDALRELERMGEDVPYGVSVGEEEIAPWGFTDNGDVLFWVTRGWDDPDRWTVAVNEGREPTWIAFEGKALEFLVAVLSGALHVDIFPDSFPLREHAFATS